VKRRKEEAKVKRKLIAQMQKSKLSFAVMKHFLFEVGVGGRGDKS